MDSFLTDKTELVKKLEGSDIANVVNNSIDKEENLQRELIELGFLGKFFGKGESSSKNIAFVLCIIVFLCYLGLVIFVIVNEEISESTKSMVATFMAAALNLITAFIGYLFGKEK